MSEQDLDTGKQAGSEVPVTNRKVKKSTRFVVAKTKQGYHVEDSWLGVVVSSSIPFGEARVMAAVFNRREERLPDRMTETDLLFSQISKKVIASRPSSEWGIDLEYKFNDWRKFAFDLLITEAPQETNLSHWKQPRSLVIEIEGLQGRHQTTAGFLRDMEKYNLATMSGYTILRVTNADIIFGKAVEMIAAFFFARNEWVKTQASRWEMKKARKAVIGKKKKDSSKIILKKKERK